MSKIQSLLKTEGLPSTTIHINMWIRVVTSAASTAVAYGLITAVAGVTSIAALPVVVAVGAFAVAGAAVSYAHDSNLWGFKDFTEGIGNFIDDIF